MAKVFYGDSKKMVDYVFWIVLIFFTDPGGILQAFGEDSGDGGINVTDILFAVLGICFVSVFKINYYKGDKTFIELSKFLFIFLIYYIIVFSFFIPQFKNLPDYSFLRTLVKIRFGIINFFLVQFIYVFYLRSYKIFYKVFVFSSILVLALFIIAFVTGIEILPTKILVRRYIGLNRIIMTNYGLMPILIAMGAVLLIFKFKIKYKPYILLGFLFMSIAWVLSIFRREIFGTLILFIVTSIVSNYLYKKNLIPVKKSFKVILYILILLFFVKLSFPKYFDAIVSSVEQIQSIILYGENLSGMKDARLGAGKIELQNKVLNNYIVGTGFDNNWRVSEDPGFEASDYPFLAAIAIHGILGMAIFFPIYVLLYKSIFKDLKYIRRRKINLNSFEQYSLIVFMVYFLFEILNYTYWFLPLSLFSYTKHHKWYIFLAMFMGMRYIYYRQEYISKK